MGRCVFSSQISQQDLALALPCVVLCELDRELARDKESRGCFLKIKFKRSFLYSVAMEPLEEKWAREKKQDV